MIVAVGWSVERVFQLMEAWGYPKAATDWLRRRRLIIIAMMAILSWCVFLALGWAILFLIGEFADLLGDLSMPADISPIRPASTPR